MNQRAAFFDLDRTLIDCNSAVPYARFERREGRISRRQLATGIAWSVLYHFSLIDIDRAYEKALSHYKGVPEQELRERTRRWFDLEIVQRLQPGARAALDRHRAAGERLVLLTNSSCYMAEIATERWGLDAWLANGFVTAADGTLTGTMVKPLCYGRGKVVRARRWAADNGVELSDSAFYTDSLSDLQMLREVGEPRVVNPDPRLRREASRRGWPVLDWSA